MNGCSHLKVCTFHCNVKIDLTWRCCLSTFAIKLVGSVALLCILDLLDILSNKVLLKSKLLFLFISEKTNKYLLNRK